MLTVCITTFMRDAHLFDTLDRVSRFLPGARILVADNGHDDPERAERIRAAGAGYHKLPYDSGLPACRNLLVSKVRTKHLLVIDDDVAPTEHSNVAQMLRLLDVADVVGATMVENGVAKSYEGTLSREDGGIVMRTPRPEAQMAYDGIDYVRCDFALNILVMETATAKANPWDERFKIGYEHLDFFVSAKDKGLVVAHAPGSVFEHIRDHHSRSPDYASLRYRTNITRAAFFRKWDVAHVTNLRGVVDARNEHRQSRRRMRAPRPVTRFVNIETGKTYAANAGTPAHKRMETDGRFVPEGGNMATYVNKKTGERSVTVGGSRLDRRRDADPNWKRTDVRHISTTKDREPEPQKRSTSTDAGAKDEGTEH